MSASDKKKLRKEQNAAALTEKQQKELKEAKKLKTYTLTFAVVMILVVAIVIGVSVRSPIASAINRNTHAITIGEHKLSTVDLNYYYIDAVNEYYNEVYSDYYQSWGNYWAMFLGFNADEPLDEQYQDEEKNITWAQYFVDLAIGDATKVYAVYDEAVSKDHKLTDEEQRSLDLLESNIKTLAISYGYSDADSYLKASYGDGANMENYVNYCEVTTYASSYATAYSEALEYTDEEIREYEKDKFFNYTKFDYSYYLIDVSKYLGEGTKGEDGKVTYTDKEKADALAAAKADADALMEAGITSAVKFDEAIKALAINKDNKNAACTQNADVFYEDLGYVEFQEWLTDENREVNELGCLPITTTTGEGDDATEETSGYMIILFQERDDCYTNLVSVRHILAEFTGYYWDTEGNKHLDDSSKLKAKEKAEGWLKEWKEGKATEESFAELANKNSDDGDGTTGGLYEDIYPGQTVEGFNEWCFDEDRKPGDTEVIETEYGYHVMYFVETEEKTFRDAMIEADMNTEDCNEWMDALTEAMEVEQVNLKGLAWDLVLA